MNKWSPKLVKQALNSSTCGQCCISMVTGLPLEMIIEQIGTKSGTNSHQVSNCFGWFGWDCEYSVRKYKGSGENLPKLAILAVGKRKSTHWVVFYNGTIYDPCGIVFDCNQENLSRIKYKIFGYMKIRIPSSIDQ